MIKRHLFTILMALFMLSGIGATVGAMRVDPPPNLDQVVMGNVDEDVVETAVVTGNEALLINSAESPTSFFAITPDDDDDK